MKQCKECKREVPNANWSYKLDLCKKCLAKKRYRDNNPELKELLGLTKEELFTQIVVLKRANKRLHDSLDIIRGNQIKHFRNRLYKIRNSIDYLLKHPFSVDSSYNTRPNKRDKMPRLSQLYHSKKRWELRKNV